jgi:signal transduction histidine kinase
MSKPQLQSPTTFNVLIVANAKQDAALVAETLRAAHLAFESNIALTEAVYLSLLHQNRYDAIIFSHRANGELDPHAALTLLHQSGQEIPFILISETLEGSGESLRARIADCVLRDRIAVLPDVLQHLLLPRPQLPRSSPSESDAIARLLQALQDCPDLEAFLARVAELLRETLDLRRCSILQPESGDWMQVRSVFPTTAQPDRLSQIEGELARHYQPLLARGNPLILPCLDEYLLPPAALETSPSNPVGGLVLVPLLFRQSYLGLMSLSHWSDRHHWTETELNWTRIVATHCAIAIDRAQLSRQLQQQQQWQHLLHQISATRPVARETEANLREILARVGKNFEVDRVLLACIDEEHIGVEQEWRSRREIPSLLKVRVPAVEWQELLAPGSEYRTHRYFQTANFAEYCAEKEQTARAIAQSQTCSTLGLPIFIQERLFGSLILQTISRSRTFSPGEISILGHIADQIAIAIATVQRDECFQQEVEERTEQLEAANRAKSEFLSSMSHELRAPLTSVIGFARVLLEQIYGELNTKQTQYINAIADSGEHLLSLINDLLDISKIEANKEELYVETLSVEEVCLSSLALLEERAQQAGLQLKLEIGPSVTVCHADRRRLKQILVNLLSNAIKFTETGSVTLKVELQENQLNFAVIDTGIGMSETDRQILFQPFQQIKTHLHRKHKGSGLGLALSRKLARLHDGDLTVTSEVGQGSCFTLSLPMQIPS